MKGIAISLVGLFLAFAGRTALADGGLSCRIATWMTNWHTISRMKPKRLDGPLREDNISDIEVREIELETRKTLPGAIVNISGVTVGCPCEDGPACAEQVWIVAYRPDRSQGLMLSRIQGQWVTGPVQQWWLSYSDLSTRMSILRRRGTPESMKEYLELFDQRNRLGEEFPQCVDQEYNSAFKTSQNHKRAPY